MITFFEDGCHSWPVVQFWKEGAKKEFQFYRGMPMLGKDLQQEASWGDISGCFSLV
jgi:hypothetical protein